MAPSVTTVGEHSISHPPRSSLSIAVCMERSWCSTAKCSALPRNGPEKGLRSVLELEAVGDAHASAETRSGVVVTLVLKNTQCANRL